nr:MAG: hypothetical protein [Bacteriophage sp.]
MNGVTLIIFLSITGNPSYGPLSIIVNGVLSPTYDAGLIRLIKLDALSNQLKAAVGDLINEINSNGLYIVLNSNAERIAR